MSELGNLGEPLRCAPLQLETVAYCQLRTLLDGALHGTWQCQVYPEPFRPQAVLVWSDFRSTRGKGPGVFVRSIRAGYAEQFAPGVEPVPAASFMAMQRVRWETPDAFAEALDTSGYVTGNPPPLGELWLRRLRRDALRAEPPWFLPTFQFAPSTVNVGEYIAIEWSGCAVAGIAVIGEQPVPGSY